MTGAEKALWNKLRANQLGVKFRRQHVIGRYIVDFVCLERKLVVEVDVGQRSNKVYDTNRDQWLAREGYRVLHFWNREVLKHPDSVLQVIQEHLKKNA